MSKLLLIIHTKKGGDGVNSGVDDLLARSMILTDPVLIGGISSSILFEHEVEEVYSLQGVADGHVVKYLTIRHGCNNLEYN